MKQLYMLRAFLIVCMSVFFGGGNFALAQDLQETVVATFESATVVNNSSYQSYSNDDWNISIGGNNKSIGFNNKNMKAIGDALGTDAVATNYGPVVKSLNVLNNINKITFAFNGGSGVGGQIYLAYSTDNITWNAVELKTGEGLATQGNTVTSSTTQSFIFEFETIESAYYGIILDSGGTKKAAYRFDNVVITFINVASASSDPAINATDPDAYAADITSGEIPYTISNLVEGTNLTATTTTEWISDVTVGESAVNFTMTENTGAERTGTITLSYGDLLTKDITVKQLAAVAKHTVTIEEPENGTLKVFRGEEEIVSGAQLPGGTELTIEATPAEGYKFKNWQAVDGSTHTYTANFTYTIGESDVTIKANFDAIVYNTITWSVNGVESTTTVEQGSDITFTAPETVPGGYTFMGWLGETYGPSDEAPAFVTSAKAAGDVTYYAVFAKGSGAEETATLTASHTKESTGYAAHTYTDDKENTWTTYSNEQGAVANGDARFGLNKNTGYYFGSPLFSGNVTKIVMNVYNGSSSSTRTFYIDSEQTNQNGDLGTIAVAGGEKKVDKEITFDGQFNQFYIHSSDALSFLYIKVTYGSKTYTGYTTTVSDAPTSATLNFVAQNADGYYATFSSDKDVVFTSDVIVYAANVNGTAVKLNALASDLYEVTDATAGESGLLDGGYYVPANTGVLVYSMDETTTTYYFPAETAEVQLPANMLEAATADGVFEGKDGYCYYKLAYNDYTSKTDLGFYYGAADGAPFAVKKGLAYLAVPTTSGAAPARFVLGGDTDAISSVNSDVEKAETVIYTIAGQRVGTATKPGLYIVNGKKLIVK